MKIYITRHSLTAWNEEKRLQGWKDSPLTKQGKEDALKLGEYMKTIHIDQVYSSPLLRAKSTARLIFKNENIIEDSRLRFKKETLLFLFVASTAIVIFFAKWRNI